MSATPPVSFTQLAQTPANPASGGYPYRIRGTDLDKNFVFATLDVEDGLVQTTTGAGGHPQRRLKIPAPGNSGEKQNLTSTGNLIEWTEAIPDGEYKGQFLRWDNISSEWKVFPKDTDEANNEKIGAFPQWTTEGWKALGEGADQQGLFLKWDNILKQWVKFSGAADGNFPQWSDAEGWEDKGAGTVEGQLLQWNDAEKKWLPFSGMNGQLLVAEFGGWVPFDAPTSEKTVLTAKQGELSWEPAIPEPPSSGTYVLGSVGGTLQWIATEECEQTSEN